MLIGKSCFFLVNGYGGLVMGPIAYQIELSSPSIERED